MINLHFYFMSLLSTYMCTTSMQFPQKPEEGISFPGIWVTDWCESQCRCCKSSKSSSPLSNLSRPHKCVFKDAFFFLRNIPMNTTFSRSFQMPLKRILSRSRIQQLYLVCHSLYICIISLCNVMNHIKREWVQKDTVTSQEWDRALIYLDFNNTTSNLCLSHLTEPQPPPG